MATDPRKSDFISEARQETRKFWSAYLKLLSFQNEWNAQSYSTTMDTEDFTNENAGLTAAQIGAVVFDTMNAVKAQMDAGHATNVTNIL